MSTLATSPRRRRWWEAAGMVAFAVVAVGMIWLIERRAEAQYADSMAEAFAALAAAFLAAVGSFHGHRRGRDRSGRVRRTSRMIDRPEAAALIATSVVVLLGAFGVAELLDLSPAAVTAVAGAVATITLVDALHDLSPRLRTSSRLGVFGVAAALVLGLVAIWIRQDNAEAVAAVASAFVAAGATQHAHVQGFQAGQRIDAG